jgi:hypothetical protein
MPGDMKMRRHLLLLTLLLVLPWNTACEDSTDRVDQGGVALRVTDFGTLPLVLDLDALGLLQLDAITLSNDALTGGGTLFQDIQLDSYEVTYTRGDRGSAVPRPLVERIFSTVPANGQLTLNNLNFLRLDQVSGQPFSGLALDGRDDETGSAAITLNVHFRFFGKTLSGRTVVSNTASFTIEVVP